MDWKKYETEIFETFKAAYPNAKINFNQKVIGRYSKVERQIDVLIEGRIAGKKIKLVIDGKYYSKNVDVKAVETFLGMLEDIGTDQGILISSKGYSKGAINRAYYGPTDIELDILNFDDLKQFQGFGGFAYSGRHGAMIPAPFGWIIDGTRRQGCIANIYQRGKTYEEAVKYKEFIYVNILSFDETIKDLDDVIKLHEESTLEFHTTAKFHYSESIERKDKKKTVLRKILREETQLEEYTGFVEFDDFCIFCVLLTPEELKNKNIRKLEYVIERLLPMEVDLNSVAATRISKIRSLIEKSKSDEEKAGLLITIGDINRDLEEFDSARKAYTESIEYFPECYGAHLGLLELDYNTPRRDESLINFYNLAPGSRQICDNLVRLGIENNQIEFTETFLLKKLNEIVENYESFGDIYFSLADLFYTDDSIDTSLKYFKLAQFNYEKCFDNQSPELVATINAIYEIEKTSNK